MNYFLSYFDDLFLILYTLYLQTVLALRKKRSKYDTTPEQIAEKMFEICDKNDDDKLTKVEFITTFMEDPVLYAIFCGTMTEEDEEDT